MLYGWNLISDLLADKLKFLWIYLFEMSVSHVVEDISQLSETYRETKTQTPHFVGKAWKLEICLKFFAKIQLEIFAEIRFKFLSKSI